MMCLTLAASCPGIKALWVLYTTLILYSSGVAYDILFCKHYLVHFCRVNHCVKLKHVVDLADNNSEVLLLVTARVEQLYGESLRRQFDRS
jgi:hypothetical protein